MSLGGLRSVQTKSSTAKHTNSQYIPQRSTLAWPVDPWTLDPVDPRTPLDPVAPGPRGPVDLWTL